jgi:hypothetical protein
MRHSRLSHLEVALGSLGLVRLKHLITTVEGHPSASAKEVSRFAGSVLTELGSILLERAGPLFGELDRQLGQEVISVRTISEEVRLLKQLLLADLGHGEGTLEDELPNLLRIH